MGTITNHHNIANNTVNNTTTNTTTKSTMFNQYATTMHEFSSFMIAFTKLNDQLKSQDRDALLIGNIFSQSFAQILTSPARRAWLHKQLTRNNNIECLECNKYNCCLMEFWKTNNKGDDCYGAKRYVEWLLSADSKASGDRVNRAFTAIANLA